MTQFTEQDWLDDKLELPKLDENFFYEGYFEEYSAEEKKQIRDKYSQHNAKGAVVARFNDGELSEKLRSNFETKQKEGFEMEVECSLAQSKKRWKEVIINLPADELLEAVNDEIKAATRGFESSINSDGIVFKASEKELLEAKRGIIPDLSDLKGSHYKEIKENYDLMKRWQDFKVTYFCPTSGRRAAWLYLKFLGREKERIEIEEFRLLNNMGIKSVIDKYSHDIWGKYSAFISKEEYEEFIKILENFFINESEPVGNHLFRTQKDTKTRLEAILKKIYYIYKSKGTLPRATSFFKIVRFIDDFQHFSDEEIRVMLQKADSL